MATRSFIGLEQDKQVKYIYCHHDGYLEGVGAVLLQCYKKLDKVKQLIKLGDISSIRQEIEQIQPYDKEPHITFCRLDEYLNQSVALDLNIEYFYLFKENKWLYAPKDKEFKTLTDKVILQELVKRMNV